MFYTYLWLRYDGTPYYVGKGTRDRAFTNCGRKVTRRPEDKTRIIIQEFESEEDSFEAEKFLIAYYGRKDLGAGCLQNRTDGGEGAAGHVHSEEHKRKIGLGNVNNPRNRGQKMSELTKQRMSEAALGRKVSDETRKRMIAAKTGVKMSETARRNMSAAHIGKTLSEETCRKMSAAITGDKNHFFGKKHNEATLVTMRIAAGTAMRGKTHSEETKKKMSLAAKGRTFSAETRERMSLARRLYCDSLRGVRSAASIT
jgi:hypothetical protein